ncbi:hypothetical protein BRADI_2g49743v3 [Brachypodium distachyon]|uniref:Uncharacterized protein n=1 Tax=Brachypodium distachyon TaxID=15368 RepID=A0A2K2DEZ7_BRADI|nr:hypothetical protein BRADI_2g49743v3 [Brachypodium distachyon]
MEYYVLSRSKGISATCRAQQRATGISDAGTRQDVVEKTWVGPPAGTAAGEAVARLCPGQ